MCKNLNPKTKNDIIKRFGKIVFTRKIFIAAR